MTLEEFINYFEEESKAHTNLVPFDVDEQYNKNCKQLAGWLRELKAYKEDRHSCESCEHEYNSEHQLPCSECSHNFKDRWEWRGEEE